MFGSKEKLHHAYLIEGNFEEINPLIFNYLEKELDFSIKNNPDFWQESFDVFGIDDGRKIREMQNKKAFANGKKIFIIQTDFITREAQNSLLKMFEEPTDGTHFFIIMNSSENLLPTLKSRLFILRNDKNQDSYIDLVKEYLENNIDKKLNLIKIFLGDKKKKILADKKGAIFFLNELEKQLREKTDFKKISKKEISIFEEIIKARSYLRDTSSSVKIILEHISIIL